MDSTPLPNDTSGSSRTYAMISNMFDMLAVGIACVRKNGEIMYANQAAIEMLSRAKVLLSNVEPANFDGKINDSTLKKLRLDTRQTTVIRLQQLELQIQVEPFQSVKNDVDEVERRHGAMLILHESGRVDLPSVDQLKSLYGLTQAEARLALTLCAGDTPTECANQLGVSITTVRSQVRAVMEKTGSKRQAELITKLLSSPSASVRTK